MLLLGNIIFFIFGGFIIFFGYVLGGVILCLTIVGCPLAVQHMKLVKVALLPFGHVMREVRDQTDDSDSRLLWPRLAQEVNRRYGTE